jgi:hypothetical protein
MDANNVYSLKEWAEQQHEEAVMTTARALQLQRAGTTMFYFTVYE